MNYKYTISQKNIPRQAKINKKHISNPRPSQRNLKKIDKLCQNLRITLQLVLDYLLRYKGKYKYLHMAQSTIAKEIGRSRQEVNRALQELESLGFISIWFRDFNTCFYWISNCFNHLDIRHKLSNLFPVLALENILVLLLLNQSPNEANEKKPDTIFKLASLSYIYNQAASAKCNITAYEENNITSEVLLRSARTRERLFSKKESMKELRGFNFSQEQLEELAHYSTDVLQMALKKYQQANNGKIANQFGFLSKICERLAREAAQRKLSNAAPEKKIEYRNKSWKSEDVTDAQYLEYEDRVKRAEQNVKAAQRSYDEHASDNNARNLNAQIQELERRTKTFTSFQSFYALKFPDKTPQRERQCIEPNAQHYVYANELGAVMPDTVKEELLMKVSRDATLLESNPVLKIILEEYLRRRKTISNPATSC